MNISSANDTVLRVPRGSGYGIERNGTTEILVIERDAENAHFVRVDIACRRNSANMSSDKVVRVSLEPLTDFQLLQHASALVEKRRRLTAEKLKHTPLSASLQNNVAAADLAAYVEKTFHDPIARQLAEKFAAGYRIDPQYGKPQPAYAYPDPPQQSAARSKVFELTGERMQNVIARMQSTIESVHLDSEAKIAALRDLTQQRMQLARMLKQFQPL